MNELLSLMKEFTERTGWESVKVTLYPDGSGSVIFGNTEFSFGGPYILMLFLEHGDVDDKGKFIGDPSFEDLQK